MIVYKSLIGRSLTLAFALAALFSSCKKNSDRDNDNGYQVKSDVRDSAYIYTQDYYLWPEKLPAISVFQPRNSQDIFEVMDKVKTYQPLDKWSFAETKLETQQSSKGIDTDFGFLVKFIPGSNTEIRVSYVYSASSAGQKGVQRSWRIIKIDGRVIDRSVPADFTFINDIFFGSPTSALFEFMKPDGTRVSLTLSKTAYVLNTVLFKNVYTKGTKKIGYFVFNQFSGATSVTELVNTFNYFQNEGVNEMIIDLRYNRGGFVSTQDTLANMLAPTSVGRGQKVMYTYKFNDKYSKYNETNKFYKVGNLNLNRIVFIVSPSSASASELLINNLKPVINEVKLVGDTRTYGKPVGFFPISVFEYNIFPVSFKTVNSNGEADYFAGFPVNKNVADDLSRDFGNEEELNLKEALKYLTTGAFTASVSAERSSVSAAEISKTAQLNYDFAEHRSSATIENRPSKMPISIRRLQK
jgi:C-terminal processing protease CtpA/Prc